MSNILDQILTTKRREVEILKQNYSSSDFEKADLFKRKAISLSHSLASVPFGIIGEIKRKSPSAGTIDESLSIEQKAKSYTDAKVQGISCLTDFDYFGGSIDDLKELRNYVNIPILRKEFIVDELQILEAKASGADAILLIAEALTKTQIDAFILLAHNIGLEVLLELHEEGQLEKTFGHADIIGVNNRDLKLQITDIQTSIDLFDRLPKDKLKITESGITKKAELEVLSKIGFRGALIGQSILTNKSPEVFIQNLLPNV
jgi:indole-3-glycerol phosphate synthase